MYGSDLEKLDPNWRRVIQTFYLSEVGQRLADRLHSERQHHCVFPPPSDLFHALELTPIDQVKIVILGQDPYHGPGQAHGLAFSVPAGIKLPPSLKNIIKELHSDIPENSFTPQPQPISSGDATASAEANRGPGTNVCGDLQHWAEQGVLLLNTCLTVRQGAAASHRDWGWQTLTDQIMQTVNQAAAPTVFLLWGNDAISKRKWIDPQRHLVLTSVHPSPLSAYRGFFGSRPFSQANRFLETHGRSAIQW